MGVSGAGKTTVGKELSVRLNYKFYDADDFHSEGNIKKMSQGVPLNEKDRTPWLNDISKKITEWIEKKENVFLACSVLKEKYRQKLVQNIENKVVFIYLKIDIETVIKRLSSRENHFFPVALLQSQYDILEETSELIEIDAIQEIDGICKELIERIVK
jgi:carbohydrate kinase (thermoresistant glucokinase family)